MFKVDSIKEKYQNTVISTYGVSNVSQIKEVKNKKHETMYKNGTCPTSTQQRNIYELYSKHNLGAELNYPISYYSADICFPEEKLVVEVDFRGHNLSVKTGKITQEEFNQKEIVRNNVLKREGYKTVHLISKTDKLPSDQILLQLLSYARTYFSEYPHHSWCSFDIDASKVFNAENKEGVFFNFGELRRTHKETA